jgi:hypothetical protein
MVADGDEIGGTYDSLTVAGSGTWLGLKSNLLGSVFGRSALKLALQYLGRSDAAYLFMPDAETPTADADSTGFVTTDLTAKTVRTADKAAFGDSGGVRYRLTVKPEPKEPTSTLTIDVLDGRIVAETAGDSISHLSSTWVYGGEDIAAPGEDESVSFDLLSPALEAAMLPATLKAQARKIAKQTRTSARKKHLKVSAALIRRFAVTTVKKANKDGRSIRTRTAKVKNGARIVAVNPYTHKNVVYRIVVVRGKVVVS